MSAKTLVNYMVELESAVYAEFGDMLEPTAETKIILDKLREFIQDQ